MPLPSATFNALTALYHATDGPSWTNNNGWLTGDPCAGCTSTCTIE